MAKSLVILLLCLSSAYSETVVKVGMTKAMMSEKMEGASSVDSAMTKEKRDSYPYHGYGSTPCPPYQHQHSGYGYHMPHYPKVSYAHQPSYAHKPAVTVVKAHAPSYHQSSHYPSQSYGHSYGYNYGHSNYGWNSYGHNSYGHNNYGWNSYQKPSYQSSYQHYQPKVIIQKSQHSYAPQYHKPSYHVPNYHQNLIKPAVVVKPDCPPYQHQHSSGIVYSPQHQHHQQPEVVKVVKPAYHHPQPTYHQPSYHQPSYHQPSYHQPIYHKPISHYPKEICH